MTETKRTKRLLIFGFLFVVLMTHIPVAYTLFYHRLTGAPTAKDGRIDLEQRSPDRNIILDGKWEFYWNRLIETEPPQSSEPDFLIRVPDCWTRYKTNGNWLPAGGFASYRLTLRGLDSLRPVTLYIPDFSGAYRVYIDGVLAAQSGIVSKDAAAVFTVPSAMLYPVSLSAKSTHEAVIEVASTKFSGLYMTPVLRDYDHAIQENSDRSSVRFILFGTVLFSFFVLIVIYKLSFRKNIHSAWLPAMIFFVLLRIMLTTEFYSFWQRFLFFSISFETTNALMFFVSFVLKFLLIFLIQEQFGIFFSKKETCAFFLYYAVLYLIYFFIPREIYNRHLTVILPALTFVLEFYAFFKVYFGRHKLKKFAMLIYWGVVLAVTGLIIDCYYINGNIYMNMSLALLTLISAFLIIISLVYAMRIADLYNDYAKSSSKLELANTQIAMQKEYYDALGGQMNEIRAIKHDIRHFISVISSLAAENRYDELNRFINEYAQKTETEQLPVFCNHVVANTILGYYYLRAKENAISFRCQCSIDMQITINDSDLCVVLGNALENAVEACRQPDAPDVRYILVESRPMGGQQLLKIENSFNGHLLIKDGRYISSKNEKFHGLGMQNMKKVVESYHGYMKTSHNENVFTLMAAFPNDSCAAFKL